jgi:hypothetical protein
MAAMIRGLERPTDVVLGCTDYHDMLNPRIVHFFPDCWRSGPMGRTYPYITNSL